MIRKKVELEIKEYEPINMKPLSGVKNPWETLSTGLRVLKGMGLKHWISCGTLLGLYRDGKLIDSDTDLDVGVLTSITNNFGPRGEEIAALFPDNFRVLRTLSFDGNVMQLAFKDNRQNDVIFDIYFYYEDGHPGLGRYGHLININSRTPILYKPAGLFEKIRTWDSPLGPVPVPDDIEAYLEMRYGVDWETPSSSKGIYEAS